jgi:hypothetical protein
LPITTGGGATVSDDADVGAPDFPAGIDYERWTLLVNPAPREAFADRLVLLDEENDGED